MKKIKYYCICLIGYAPIVVGVIALIFVWFIKLPYSSTFYYCSTDVFCEGCSSKLDSDTKFCPGCSKLVADVAAIETYTHCNYCTNNTLYKNSTSEYCTNCGKSLMQGCTMHLADLGFKDVKAFRYAVMKDNLFRLFSNKVMVTVIILIGVYLTFNWIRGYMLACAKRRIIREGLQR